jgi:hypothetical protein
MTAANPPQSIAAIAQVSRAILALIMRTRLNAYNLSSLRLAYPLEQRWVIFELTHCNALFDKFLKLFFGGHGRFNPGPWNLGRFSLVINAIAFGFACFIIPVLCFPTQPIGKGLNAQNFNYTSLILYVPLFLFVSISNHSSSI